MLQKRALIITDVMFPGGVDTYIEQLVHKAINRGWNVNVLIEKATGSYLYQLLKNVCNLHLGNVYHRKYSENTITTDFVSILNDLPNLSLAHIVCGVPWSCLLVREILLDRELPILNTEQYIPNNIDFSREALNRLKKIYSKTSKVIFVEESNLHYMKTFLGELSGKNYCIIHNSIDVQKISLNALAYFERIKSIEDKLSQCEKLSILSIGRLTYQKGFDILVRAVSQIEERERKKIQVDIYGNGPVYGRLIEAIQHLALSDYINIYNWSSDVLSLFKSYDIFILPSRSEGFSFTLLEAFASNIPLIISNISSNISLSSNGKYAEVFNLEDSKTLATILKSWIKDPLAKIRNFRDSGAWLDRKFNSEINLSKVIDIWDEIYDRKNENSRI